MYEYTITHLLRSCMHRPDRHERCIALERHGDELWLKCSVPLLDLTKLFLESDAAGD
jgi:hypothetical protein